MQGPVRSMKTFITVPGKRESNAKCSAWTQIWLSYNAVDQSEKPLMQNLLEHLIHHDGIAINFKLLTGSNAVHSESLLSSCPKLLLWGVHSVSEHINQFTNITVACLVTTNLWLLFQSLCQHVKSLLGGFLGFLLGIHQRQKVKKTILLKKISFIARTNANENCYSTWLFNFLHIWQAW